MADSDKNQYDELYDRLTGYIDESMDKLRRSLDRNATPEDQGGGDADQPFEDEVSALESAIEKNDEKEQVDREPHNVFPSSPGEKPDWNELLAAFEGKPSPSQDGEPRSLLDDIGDIPDLPIDPGFTLPRRRGRNEPFNVDIYEEPLATSRGNRGVSFISDEPVARPGDVSASDFVPQSTGPRGTARVEHTIRVEVSPNSDLVSEINKELVPAVVNLIASMKAELQDEWQTQIEIIEGGGTIQ